MKHARVAAAGALQAAGWGLVKAAERFHTYAVEWDPTYVTWLIDDVPVRTVTRASGSVALTRSMPASIWRA